MLFCFFSKGLMHVSYIGTACLILPLVMLSTFCYKVCQTDKILLGILIYAVYNVTISFVSLRFIYDELAAWIYMNTPVRCSNFSHYWKKVDTTWHISPFPRFWTYPCVTFHFDICIATTLKNTNPCSSSICNCVGSYSSLDSLNLKKLVISETSKKMWKNLHRPEVGKTSIYCHNRPYHYNGCRKFGKHLFLKYK